MQGPTVVQTSTPMSTVSSTTTVTTTTATNNLINAQTGVQSGPYTRAQFQNTMEGSRSVKNIQEIEQLLRDYPAALELYRTGRYKVKIKNEADIERVILVEKRANKIASANLSKAHENQVHNVSNSDGYNQIDRKRDTSRENQSHIRSQSHDRTVPVTSITENNAVVQTAGSSLRLPSNTQPKVDNHRVPSKERETSVTSQPKQEQEQPQPQPQQQLQSQEQETRRSNSRGSRSKTSHSKTKGRKTNHEYQNAVVPYAPNANGVGNIWQPSRVPQPYYSNPLISNQPLMPNMYMPSPYVPLQYPGYQQPYYYSSQPYPALAFQKPTTYPASSSIKSTTTATHKTVPGLHNYPSPSQSGYYPSQGVALPPTFHTFHLNQQPYPQSQNVYNPQLPFQIPAAWPPRVERHAGSAPNQTDNRQAAKHRARSLDTGSRGNQPVRFTNIPPILSQPQAPIVVSEHHHHHHHHRQHHHRPQHSNIQVNNTDVPLQPGNDQNTSSKDPTTSVPVNRGGTGEKLTIRQLNEIFLRTDPSGRLPYNALPNILQRFGIVLTENDLTSAAQKLEYNPNEPLSARRVVHILVDLGKIAKSTTSQQRPTASPIILPEDREVNEIMTQRRTVGATSTHVHSSLYPNYWY